MMILPVLSETLFDVVASFLGKHSVLYYVVSHIQTTALNVRIKFYIIF